MPKLSLQFPNLNVRSADFDNSITYNAILNITNAIRRAIVDIHIAVNNIYLGPELPSYTVAGVPSAATNTARMIYISDEVGGAVPAFSDGTNWRRVTDRAIIS